MSMVRQLRAIGVSQAMTCLAVACLATACSQSPRSPSRQWDERCGSDSAPTAKLPADLTAARFRVEEGLQMSLGGKSERHRGWGTRDWSFEARLRGEQCEGEWRVVWYRETNCEVEHVLVAMNPAECRRAIECANSSLRPDELTGTCEGNLPTTDGRTFSVTVGHGEEHVECRRSHPPSCVHEWSHRSPP